MASDVQRYRSENYGMNECRILITTNIEKLMYGQRADLEIENLEDEKSIKLFKLRRREQKKDFIIRCIGFFMIVI